MKEIIFSNYDDIKNPYYGGGGAIAIHETARRLAREFKITVITGKYKGSKNRKIDEVNYKRIGVALGGPKIGQIVFQLLLPFYVRKVKFDIWFESFTPPISTTFLQLFTRKPVVGLVHMLSGSDMKRKYKLPFDLFENIGLRTYRYFIVTNPIIQKHIAFQNSKSVISYIPNGVNKFSIMKNKEKKQILFLGRIEVNQKGIDLLIKALSKINKNKRLKLMIAGGGEEKQLKLLERIINREKLESEVEMVGKVEGSQKEKLFSESICLVVPSRFETFSLVSLEALANGLPLINFDIRGLSWIPNNASVKVKPFNILKLSNAIEEVVTSKKLRKSLAFYGKKYANEFTWEKNSLKYRNLINNLI